MRTILVSCLAALLSLAAPVHAQFIEIRLSYKAVLDPATGLRARNFTDAQIDQAIAEMNQMHAAYGRGFRFVRADAVWNVGGLGDTTGPGRWYGVNFFDSNNGGVWKDQMEAAARNDARYVWRNDMINIYITDGINGGVCSFTDEGDNILIIGAGSAGDGELHLHELGHYFGLYHTQGAFCAGCGTGPGMCNVPGDDAISDTLPDLPCWSQDNIAVNAFGQSYGNLTSDRQQQVDNVFFNVMSYHASPTPRLTERQLDRWTDFASNQRRAVCSGRTWFASEEGCLFPNGDSTCGLFVGAYRWSYQAEDRCNAAGGDIITLKPGTFDASFLDKPLTLRATRAGPARLSILVFTTP
jgi:hypothetical protein